MAEVVQLHVEDLLPGFKCLEDEGVFSNDEIQTIIKNIQNHEYKLQRTIKEKETNLKYINYLQCVLKLIQKKYDLMGVNINEDVRHMLIKKIKTEFRKLRDRHQRDNATSKPELWVSAAKWFLEGQNSWDLARKTFQKGLRSNNESPNNHLLFTEFFRFELLFIEIILKRKKMLCEQSENNEAEDQDESLYNHLRESQIENDNIISGKVAVTVFREAIKQVGIKLVVDFLEILEDFESYSFSKDLKTEIFDFMKENYSESEETWDILCKMCTSEENSMKRFKIIDQEYKNALKRFLTSERMWTLYLQNLMNSVKSNFGKKEEQFYLDKLHQELNSCFKVNLINKSTFIELFDQLSSLGCSPGYLQKLIKLAVERWENDLSVWSYFFKVQIKNNATKVEIENLFNKVIKIASNSNQLDENEHSKQAFIDLISVYVEWSIKNLSERELINTIESHCTVNPSIKDLSLSRRIASHLKPILLGQVTAVCSDSQAKRRQIYEKFKMMNPIIKEFFVTMIELEINELDTITDISVKLIRRVFNEMLSQFGRDDHKLWLDFCEFKLKYGSYVEIARIYEMAKKQLNPTESDLFVENYSLLNRKLTAIC